MLFKKKKANNQASWGRKPPRYFQQSKNGRKWTFKLERGWQWRGRGRGQGQGRWTASRGGEEVPRPLAPRAALHASGLLRAAASERRRLCSQCRLRSVLVLCFHLVLSGAEVTFRGARVESSL